MTKQEYQILLKQAPQDHFSKEFQLFLINNNKVRSINSRWLVIENCKYHDDKNDWLTAFHIGGWKLEADDLEGIKDLDRLHLEFPDREILIKAPNKRSVKLFHVHLYKV